MDRPTGKTRKNANGNAWVYLPESTVMFISNCNVEKAKSNGAQRFPRPMCENSETGS
jgi:hypothetical protein